jgi:hypothetical protein
MTSSLAFDLVVRRSLAGPWVRGSDGHYVMFRRAWPRKAANRVTHSSQIATDPSPDAINIRSDSFGIPQNEHVLGAPSNGAYDVQPSSGGSAAMSRLYRGSAEPTPKEQPAASVPGTASRVANDRSGLSSSEREGKAMETVLGRAAGGQRLRLSIPRL